MTPAEHAHAVSKEIAAHDLADIKALRESEAFKRYWIRRMNERHAKLATAFKYDVMSHEERETHRQIVLEYEDIARMMEKDEVACQNLLSGQNRVAMPGTQGNG